MAKPIDFERRIVPTAKGLRWKVIMDSSSLSNINGWSNYRNHSVKGQPRYGFANEQSAKDWFDSLPDSFKESEEERAGKSTGSKSSKYRLEEVLDWYLPKFGGGYSNEVFSTVRQEDLNWLGQGYTLDTTWKTVVEDYESFKDATKLKGGSV